MNFWKFLRLSLGEHYKKKKLLEMMPEKYVEQIKAQLKKRKRKNQVQQESPAVQSANNKSGSGSKNVSWPNLNFGY